MANLRLSEKTNKAALQRGLYIRDREIDRKAKKPLAPVRKRIDPKERGWAHAYLKHVAELKGLPYRSVRESMQLMGSYFGIDVPVEKDGASRSVVAIGLAKAIYARTGINLPRHQ